MTEEYLKQLRASPLSYFEDQHSLPRHAILHWMRRRLEDLYRWQLFHLATHSFSMHRPKLDRLDDLQGHLDPKTKDYRDDHGPMAYWSAIDFYNKTTPFYIVAKEGYTMPLNVCLQNWLF